MTEQESVDEFTLSDRTRDVLGTELVEGLAGQPLDSERHEAILAGIGARALRQTLDDAPLSAIAGFVPGRSRALLLRNLPVPRPGLPVPAAGGTDDLALAPVNALQLGLLRLCGLTPYSVPYENEGRLIGDVVLDPAMARSGDYRTEDAAASWRTDNPWLPFGFDGADPRAFIPRYLTCYAVRNPGRVPTEVVSADTVLDRLDADSRGLLAEPGFFIGGPAAADRRVIAPDSVPRRLVDDTTERSRLRYDPSAVAAASPRYETALAAWREVLKSVTGVELVLDPGDFLIFDNHRILHRRRASTAGPVRPARWLRRCYAG